MKLRIVWWVLAGMLMGSPVLAETGTRIGFVNLETVLLESKTGIQFKADIAKLKKDKDSMLRKEQDKLKQMQEAFQKEMLTLTEAQKQEREKGFQEKVRAFQTMGMNAENEVRQKQVEYERTSVNAVRAIVAQIAKNEKFNAVLVANAALYAEDGMDLTQKVIEKFDSRPASPAKK